MKKALLRFIRAYQYISALFPASCRYYPTCSEYAKWQFKFNRFDKAVANSTLRILRCNQLFRGGIDYPKVALKAPSPLLVCNLKEGINIKYWLIADGKDGRYFIVKSF
jgi:putative membrane protein insertion efficiency factor